MCTGLNFSASRASGSWGVSFSTLTSASHPTPIPPHLTLPHPIPPTPPHTLPHPTPAPCPYRRGLQLGHTWPCSPPSPLPSFPVSATSWKKQTAVEKKKGSVDHRVLCFCPEEASGLSTQEWWLGSRDWILAGSADIKCPPTCGDPLYRLARTLLLTKTHFVIFTMLYFQEFVATTQD